MLLDIDKVQLQRLLKARGMPIEQVLWSNHQVGALFHVTTASGTIYLFEMAEIDPTRIHVVRGRQEGERRRVGYLGNYTVISKRIEVGAIVHCEEMATSPIERITLLSS